MPNIAPLETNRLCLRQFTPDDAPRLVTLADAKEVAAGTFLPYPYDEAFAVEWIATQRRQYEDNTALHFAVTLAQDGTLIGSIGLEIAAAHRHARLNYWLGRSFWNRGYATEAVKAVLTYGFERLELNRIYAPHFSGNDASGRVLRKVGMVYEGRMREHYQRFGRYVDLELYGMLKQECADRSSEAQAGETPR